MEGWIKLHRKLLKHWIWQNDKYLKAWVYCLFRANHTNTKVLIGAKLIELKPGEFITSRGNFAKDTEMTEQAVRTFWSLLEADEMITKQSTSNSTKLSICNYDSYQHQQPTDNHQTTNEQPARNQRATTDNNVKKKNKEKNVNKLVSELGSSEVLTEIEEITFSFWQLFKNNLEKLNITSTDLSRAKYKTWTEPVRLMLNTDLRKKEELREIWEFLNAEDLTKDFTWSSNIRSTSKLREKFERLLTEARKNNTSTYTQELLNKYK
jgi:hypothetical protein